MHIGDILDSHLEMVMIIDILSDAIFKIWVT